MDYGAVLEQVKKAERCNAHTKKTVETHLSGVSMVAETSHWSGQESFRGFCSGGNGVFEFGRTPIARTRRAALVTSADEAGRVAADEPPRGLSREEKFGIARLCRQQYEGDDEAIWTTIEDCERCPPMREYLLWIDRFTTVNRDARRSRDRVP